LGAAFLIPKLKRKSYHYVQPIEVTLILRQYLLVPGPPASYEHIAV